MQKRCWKIFRAQIQVRKLKSFELGCWKIFRAQIWALTGRDVKKAQREYLTGRDAEQDSVFIRILSFVRICAFISFEFFIWHDFVFFARISSFLPEFAFFFARFEHGKYFDTLNDSLPYGDHWQLAVIAGGLAVPDVCQTV